MEFMAKIELQQLCRKCGGRRCLSHLLHHLLMLCCYKSCRYYIAHPFVFIFRFWKWVAFVVFLGFFFLGFSYCLFDFAKKFEFLVLFFLFFFLVQRLWFNRRSSRVFSDQTVLFSDNDSGICWQTIKHLS